MTDAAVSIGVLLGVIATAIAAGWAIAECALRTGAW
jgi:hypothetical protein